MRDTSKDTDRIDRIWRWIHNNIPGEPRDDADVADVVIRLLKEGQEAKPFATPVAERRHGIPIETFLDSMKDQPICNYEGVGMPLTHEDDPARVVRIQSVETWHTTPVHRGQLLSFGVTGDDGNRYRIESTGTDLLKPDPDWPWQLSFDHVMREQRGR
jgi:hypothetical protein